MNGALAWTTPSDPVLPEVPSLVGPVVRRSVDHAQVGRRGMVEVKPLERVGIAVLAAVGVRRRPLDLQSDEACLVLDGDRVPTRHRVDPEATVPPGIPAEADGTLRRCDFVGAVGPRPADHVDDGFEVGAQQHLEGTVTLAGGRRDERGHAVSVAKRAVRTRFRFPFSVHLLAGKRMEGEARPGLTGPGHRPTGPLWAPRNSGATLNGGSVRTQAKEPSTQTGSGRRRAVIALGASAAAVFSAGWGRVGRQPPGGRFQRDLTRCRVEFVGPDTGLRGQDGRGPRARQGARRRPGVHALRVRPRQALRDFEV